MKEAQNIAEIGAHNEIRIIPARVGGFIVLQVRGGGFNQEPIAAMTTVRELLETVGRIYTKEVTVTDSVSEPVGDTADKSNADEVRDMHSAFYIGTEGQRGSSVLRAAANTIIKIKTKWGDHVEYGFLDERAAQIAYSMLETVGAEVARTKSRDGDTTQPAEEEPRATDNVEGAMAPDMVDEEYRYLAVYGQSKGGATSKIVAYDEQTALAIVKAVLDVGGFGWTETIRSV